VTARDIRYGRRGGRWADPQAGRLLEAVTQARAADRDRQAVDLDASVLFHPETIAQTRAHQRRRPGTCAKDKAGSKAERRRVDCTCRPDPEDLAAVWAGRARMARARRNTGQPLDDIDRQALARHPDDRPAKGAAS
jgi:hypothetical protein